MTMEGYYRQIDLLNAALERAQKNADAELVRAIAHRVHKLRANAPFKTPSQEPCDARASDP